jgi:hypothetical protein
MPIRQGGILANRASTWPRDHFCRSTIAPRQGCQVFSYKHPSAAELEHDFLWRTSCDLPERGRIGIFNRSYYEEVLIVRVHPEILRSEAIPGTPHHDKKVWHDRYRSIVDLEKHLHGNGTRITSSSSTSPRKNSENAFWRVSTSRKRTGNSVLLTLPRENSGSST